MVVILRGQSHVSKGQRVNSDAQQDHNLLVLRVVSPSLADYL